MNAIYIGRGEEMRVRLVSLFILVIICLSIIRVNGGGATTATITVSVSPEKVPGRVGKNIEFDIYISGIDERVLDLYGWELYLDWNINAFKLVSVIEGPFLEQAGYTYWVPPTGIDTGHMLLGSTLLDAPTGVLGEGVLATITLYVIAGLADSTFDLSEIRLVNSALDPIEPPRYNVIVFDEYGEFIPVTRAWDLEPPYGEVDIYDLGVVAASFNRNVTRPRKIPTDWAAVAVNGWKYPQNVLSSDDIRARAGSNGKSTKWMHFGFNTTGWTGVSMVEVGLEARIDSGNDSIIIAVSHDNGSTWSATTYTHNVTSEKIDSFSWINVTSAFIWAKWMVRQIAVKLTYQADGSPTPIDIDYIVVAVTPEPLLTGDKVFDPDADVTGDRWVGLDDLVTVAINYGSYALEEEG